MWFFLKKYKNVFNQEFSKFYVQIPTRGLVTKIWKHLCKLKTRRKKCRREEVNIWNTEYLKRWSSSNFGIFTNFYRNTADWLPASIFSNLSFWNIINRIIYNQVGWIFSSSDENISLIKSPKIRKLTKTSIFPKRWSHKTHLLKTPFAPSFMLSVVFLIIRVDEHL